MEDVLQVPVQSIVEHNLKHYCVVFDGDDWVAKEVTIGATNDKFVVIEDEEGGLKPGDEVVLNAAPYRDDLNLPEPLNLDGDSNSSSTGSPSKPKPAGSAPSSPSEIFSQLDQDGNGRLDAKEIGTLPQANQQRILDADAFLSEVVDFTAQLNRIDHDAVGYHRKLVVPEDA